MSQPTTPTEPTPSTEYDWEQLKREMQASGVRHTSMVAVMPQHEPIRPMSNVCPGIYPYVETKKVR